MPTKFRPVNLVLPEGLSADRYHAMAARLAAGFAGNTGKPATRSRGAEPKGAKHYLVLSKLDGAPPADAAVLNDSTWTLTVPVPAEADLEAIAAKAKALANDANVEVEFPPDYQAS